MYTQPMFFFSYLMQKKVYQRFILKRSENYREVLV